MQELLRAATLGRGFERHGGESAYNNFAKFPFELGIKLERERLRLQPRERWGEPALVAWPTTGARPPVEGGADGPARQEAFRLGGSGQP